MRPEESESQPYPEAQAPPAPSRPAILPGNVPAPLRSRPQWVLWRYVTRGGKQTKVPYAAATGREASSTDPATWCPFERAVEAWEADPRWSGIGFVFAADDPYCGVDLDDAYDPDSGALKPWAQAIVDELDTYAEISPSGTGVKLFLDGDKPGGRCRRRYHDGEVEVYDRGRFFAVTGWRLGETSAGVEPRQGELDALYARVFGEPGAPTPPARVPATAQAAAAAAPEAAAALTDAQVLQKASNARRGGPKFSALWAGRWNDYFNSPSEADASVVFTLAFYTKDAAQIDRLFRASGLMRDKWDERHGARTYGQITLDHALATVTGQWRPGKRKEGGEGAGANGGCRRVGEAAPAEPGDWDPQRLSQQANAERLVQVLGGVARFDVSRGAWVVNEDGVRFVTDDGGVVDRAAKRVARATWGLVHRPPGDCDAKGAIKHAVDSEKAAGVAAMMKLARTEAGIPVTAAAFDADPFALNTLNGVVDLRTGALRPHRRADLLTKLAPVAFDAGAACPACDAFLGRIMAGDAGMIAYLRRVAGLCLTGDASVQELFVFFGGGANGKSVLLDTLSGLMGDYAGEAPPNLLTARAHDEHPTEIADLAGKRLVIASETEEGARLRIQLVKQLTGNAVLKGRFMRQDFFAFPRTHKLILVTNNRPVIRETTNAVWRRVRLVPFAVTIPKAEQDPHLLAKLRVESPGILNWCVAGCLDWGAGGMQTPEAVTLATQSYQAEQDPLADFLAERFTRGDRAVKVTRNDLFGAYQSWCQQTGERQPLERNSLYDRVRRLEGVSDGEWRPVGSGVPARGFYGIGLAYAGTGGGGED